MIDIKNPDSQLHTRWIGIAPFKVIAINPLLDELNMLIPNKVESITPYYNPDKQTSRLDIWLNREQEHINTKVTFWISKPKASATGKFRYVDAYGQCTIYYTESEMQNGNYEREIKSGKNIGTKYNWFDVSTARPMYQDEDKMYSFLHAWLGIKSTDQCRLNNIEAFFSNDFSELQAFVPKASSREVVCALGMKGQYYQIYSTNKAFTYPRKDNTYTYLAEQIQKDNYYEINFGTYPFPWVEFNQESVNNTGQSANASSGKKDDLPF